METGFAEERQLCPFFTFGPFKLTQSQKDLGRSGAPVFLVDWAGRRLCQTLIVVQISELLLTPHETWDKSYHFCDNLLIPL